VAKELYNFPNVHLKHVYSLGAQESPLCPLPPPFSANPLLHHVPERREPMERHCTPLPSLQYIHTYTHIHVSEWSTCMMRMLPAYIHTYIRTCTQIYICTYVHTYMYTYGVATISRIDKIIGLFCRKASLLWGSFAKEMYSFIDPTNISHPIDARESYVSIYACM